MSSPSTLQVLLTGFEPFAGDAHNPSWPAAETAAAVLREQGIRAGAVRLPCVFATAGPVLDQALAEHRPEVVIAVGLAGGRRAVAVERVAVNLQDARIPDNEGQQPAGEPVVAGGPVAWFATLPVKRVAAAIGGAGIPVELSLSAGSFVCNHVFAHLMDRAGALGIRAAGFIHVPWDTEHAPVGMRATLPAQTLRDALVLAAREALVGGADMDHPDGALH